MARKKQQATLDTSSIDEMFDSATSQNKKRYSGQIFAGSEAEQLLICLPVPSLAVRYLLQQEGWPLGRFTMLVGEQESCKSAFSYEILRWHRLCKGKGILLDTEFKPAPELFWSILNYDYKAANYQKCKTMDGWNSALNNWIQTFKTLMDGSGKEKGFGRIAPVCFTIDSLMAAIDEKEYDRLVAEGIPERHYAVTAGMLNDYVRVLTKEIDEYPFSVIGTNHLKIGKTQQGTNVRNIAGGYSLKFHETTEIEMRRVSSVNPTTKSSQLKRVEDGNVVDGIELRICIMKNSAAPHSFVDVEMLWYTDFSEQVEKTVFDDESGEEKTVMIYPQRTFFDWDSASVDIVVSLLKEKTTQSRLLADVLHIEKVDRRYCWSKTLGISEKEKISAREMGALLEQELQKNPSLRDALYPVLGIRRRFMYRPGFDYRALLARIAEASHKSTAGVPDEQ